MPRNHRLRRWPIPSLSARRAWIEIRLADMSAAWNRLSLSARRAWIEILSDMPHGSGAGVALRKESVDRNVTECEEATK